MVRIADFDVEQWMDRYENTPGVLNIAETCAASISLDDLCELSDDKSIAPLDHSVKLTYGAIRGSSRLRERIAALLGGGSGSIKADNVIVTQGAIGANFLAFYSLVGPGDHVVCVYPTYQQLYSVVQSLNCEVSLWELEPEAGFIPDVSSLPALVKPSTKMIIINNPNNPTGARIPSKTLTEIVEFAKARDIILFSDEVYRPLFHDALDDNPGRDIPPPATALGYRKTVITGSMSKAYAMAGIRIGWVASPDDDLLRAMAVARDHTTISVSQLDDQVATYALSEQVLPNLLRRNVELARTNIGLLSAFVEEHSSVCSWVRPNAGTTAFIQFRKAGKPVEDVAFCVDVIEKTKVFFVPGSKCFGNGRDFVGYVRVGYVCDTDVLVEALKRLGAYVEENFV